MNISSSNLAIGISLILRDQFTGRAQPALSTMNQISNQAQQAARRQMELQRNINATGAALGAVAIRGMANWTKVGADFNYVMTYVDTIAEKKGGVGLDRLSKRAKTLGMDTMFMATQVADGMKYMAMAGMDTEAIYNNIAAAVTLAGATMERLEGKGGTADIMTNIMRGFDIEGTEKNAMRVADVLTKSVTSANTNLWDFHEAMKYSISTAKDLNVTLEETSAMIMMAGDAGIQGSMAGTATENMLRYITRAADETRKGRSGPALQALGLSPKDLTDAKGNLLAISPMMTKIAQSIQGMGTARKQNILTDLFGVRGKREASLLLRNMEMYDKYVNILTNESDGAATNSLNAQMATLKGTTFQLTSAWESFKIAFTESIEPVLIPILQGVTKLIKLIINLVETPVGKWLTVMGAGFIVVKTVAMAYRAVILSLRLLHGQLAANFGTNASSIVSGYNSMTAAATRYNAAARVGIFGNPLAGNVFAGKGGTKWVTTPQGGVKRAPSNTPVSRQIGGTRMGKYNSFAGKASIPAMLLGMGLQMGSDAAGPETGLGKGLGVAGDTLGWAGTGAMLGSIIPGVGTAVGAIVGGVGGLLWGLYNRLDSTAKEVDGVKYNMNGEEFNPEQWKNKVNQLRKMNFGDTAYLKGGTENMNSWTTKEGANNWRDNGRTTFEMKNLQNRITINIDGRAAFDKLIQEKNYQTMLDLGIY